MVNVRRYNPVLKGRLQAMVGAGAEADFPAFFAALTNAERRTAGYLLAEELLPAMPREADFSACSLPLCPVLPKCFSAPF